MEIIFQGHGYFANISLQVFEGWMSGCNANTHVVQQDTSDCKWDYSCPWLSA